MEVMEILAKEGRQVTMIEMEGQIAKTWNSMLDRILTRSFRITMLRYLPILNVLKSLTTISYGERR